MENKGFFVSFEGGEGSGKSSTMAIVADKLNELGYKVLTTREPGGTPIAEKLREIILHDDILPETEALLFAAARTEHTINKIIPALSNGYIVLSDRYIGSSFAYQGYARNLGTDAIASINDFGIKGFRPDLQIFIDVTPEIGFSRIQERTKDRMENCSMEFHNNIYNFFKNSDADYQESVNGDQTQEKVANEIIDLILKKIEAKGTELNKFEF